MDVCRKLSDTPEARRRQHRDRGAPIIEIARLRMPLRRARFKLCADEPIRGSIPLDAADVHVLSNHLAVIIGFIELMIADAEPGQPHFNDLLEIRASAVAAANLLGKTTSPPLTPDT